MIRVHRSKYSALRVERVCVSQETIVYGTEQNVAARQPIFDALSLRGHMSEIERDHQSDQRSDRRNKS